MNNTLYVINILLCTQRYDNIIYFAYNALDKNLVKPKIINLTSS